ncbi:MAG TPA: YdeI/OmpD-associated family protein [Gaiellaceae bacterium]|nr:YdeI/OmpD-associated family protein [Gaiellaceae bacterium]
MSPPGAEQPVVFFATAGELEAWLDERHDEVDGIWLKLAKKGSGIESVSYLEAVESALCFGWIDGQARGLDEQHYMQRFTPRRARSKWSKRNRGKAERLIAEGRMRPAGLAEVERARADGRWDDAYDSAATATVPDDFRVALDAEPEARAFFDTLSSSKRYSFLYRIADAKRPETRAKRIAEYVALLREGKTLG